MGDWRWVVGFAFLEILYCWLIKQQIAFFNALLIIALPMPKYHLFLITVLSFYSVSQFFFPVAYVSVRTLLYSFFFQNHLYLLYLYNIGMLLAICISNGNIQQILIYCVFTGIGLAYIMEMWKQQKKDIRKINQMKRYISQVKQIFNKLPSGAITGDNFQIIQINTNGIKLLSELEGIKDINQVKGNLFSLLRMQQKSQILLNQLQLEDKLMINLMQHNRAFITINIKQVFEDNKFGVYNYVCFEEKEKMFLIEQIIREVSPKGIMSQSNDALKMIVLAKNSILKYLLHYKIRRVQQPVKLGSSKRRRQHLKQLVLSLSIFINFQRYQLGRDIKITGYRQPYVFKSFIQRDQYILLIYLTLNYFCNFQDVLSSTINHIINTQHLNIVIDFKKLHSRIFTRSTLIKQRFCNELDKLLFLFVIEDYKQNTTFFQGSDYCKMVVTFQKREQRKDNLFTSISKLIESTVNKVTKFKNQNGNIDQEVWKNLIQEIVLTNQKKKVTIQQKIQQKIRTTQDLVGLEQQSQDINVSVDNRNPLRTKSSIASISIYFGQSKKNIQQIRSKYYRKPSLSSVFSNIDSFQQEYICLQNYIDKDDILKPCKINKKCQITKYEIQQESLTLSSLRSPLTLHSGRKQVSNWIRTHESFLWQNIQELIRELFLQQYKRRIEIPI